jgi:hypothetical protein
MLKENIFRMLEEFIIEIKDEQWFGKERELVSRFAFSKLVSNIGCCEQLFHPAQITIEVRVKQVTKGKKVKNEVCKDLIIWGQPNQTVWGKNGEYNVPLCIMEWKHRNKSLYEKDVVWLEHYTASFNDCFGVALNVENEKKYEIQAVFVENGRRQEVQNIG